MGKEAEPLTDLNLNVKIHEVDPLFTGTGYGTALWISKTVADEIDSFNVKNRCAVLDKLRYFATAGFWRFEGGKGFPIKHEWDEAYRIAYKTSSLFRIVGFYSINKTEFIAIDAFTKRKRKLSSSERGRIDVVAAVKENSSWRKAEKKNDGAN
jgi:hypothetical protein